MSGHDINDRRDVQTKEQLVKYREERREQMVARDLQTVMGTPEGRRFMHGVLKQLCEIHAFMYRPGGLPEQRDQDYLLGRQSVGLQLLEQIEKHAHPLTLHMTAEAKAAADEEAAQLKAEDALFDEDGNRIDDDAQESAQSTEDGNG